MPIEASTRADTTRIFFKSPDTGCECRIIIKDVKNIPVRKLGDIVKGLELLGLDCAVDSETKKIYCLGRCRR